MTQVTPYVVDCTVIHVVEYSHINNIHHSPKSQAQIEASSIGSTTMSQQDAPSSGKKKRAYKELPEDLRDIGPKDISSIVCALELDKTGGKEVQMAQKIVRGEKVVEISSLNVDQLRLLCRRLGIAGTASAKRDVCRHMMALCHDIN